MDELPLWQVLVDAVRSGIDVEFRTVGTDGLVCVRARWTDPRNKKTYAKQAVLDAVYAESSINPGEFVRVRTAQCVAEGLRAVTDFGQLPDDVRKRWGL